MPYPAGFTRNEREQLSEAAEERESWARCDAEEWQALAKELAEAAQRVLRRTRCGLCEVEECGSSEVLAACDKEQKDAEKALQEALAKAAAKGLVAIDQKTPGRTWHHADPV